MQGTFTIKLIMLVCILLPLSFLKAQDQVADNMLVYQRVIGGWPKHVNDIRIDYAKSMSEAEKAAVLDDKYRNDATIDNSATTKEIRYLVKAYVETRNVQYLKAAERGIRYLVKMQHGNGGFPQFYPDSSSYRNHITYNDNAMINALNVLWDVCHKLNGFEVVDASLVKLAEKAVKKGVSCILQTQIKVKGKLTAWCAQHHERTLEPVKARAYELPSISGSESVSIVQFLMKIEEPSKEVVRSIESAVEWFQRSDIEGYKYEDVQDPTMPKGRDRILIKDPGSVVWARFYDIDTNKPFFSGRDGNKKWDLAEIEHERRIGYAWYGAWAKTLLEKDYPAWLKKNRKEQ
jgi:PelA/Pel-15E family pectate lyase